jgi:hypothetical protein
MSSEKQVLEADLAGAKLSIVLLKLHLTTFRNDEPPISTQIDEHKLFELGSKQRGLVDN